MQTVLNCLLLELLVLFGQLLDLASQLSNSLGLDALFGARFVLTSSHGLLLIVLLVPAGLANPCANLGDV